MSAMQVIFPRTNIFLCSVHILRAIQKNFKSKVSGIFYQNPDLLYIWRVLSGSLFLNLCDENIDYYNSILMEGYMTTSTNCLESLNRQLKDLSGSGYLSFNRTCGIIKDFKVHYFQNDCVNQIDKLRFVRKLFFFNLIFNKYKRTQDKNDGFTELY